MAQRCTVCDHPERDAIDQALVQRAKFTDLARRYGLSISALVRHSDAHVPASLALAQQASEVARADDLLAQLQHLHTKAHQVLVKAEAAKNYSAMLGAIREARQTLEVLLKVQGRLSDAQVNVIVSHEWLLIRSTVYQALEAHPQARIEVAKALATVDEVSRTDANRFSARSETPRSASFPEAQVQS